MFGANTRQVDVGSLQKNIFEQLFFAKQALMKLCKTDMVTLRCQCLKDSSVHFFIQLLFWHLEQRQQVRID